MRLSKRKLAMVLAVSACLSVPSISSYASDWKQDSRGWQYQYSEGNVHHGWLSKNNNWYWFDSAGYMVANQFLDLNGKKFYFDSNGVMQTGWSQAHDGYWYYFNYSGEMQTGWHLISGWWYFMHPDTGRMATGWNNINNVWYYMYDSGNMAHDTWVGKYYLQSDGSMATGVKTIGGQQYIFNSNGEFIPNADLGQSAQNTSVVEELLYNRALPETTWDEIKTLANECYAQLGKTSIEGMKKLNLVRPEEHLADLDFSEKLTRSAFALALTNRAWDYFGVDDSSTTTVEYEQALELYNARNIAVGATIAKGATLDEALKNIRDTNNGRKVINNVEAKTCGIGFVKVGNEYRVVLFTGKLPTE